MRRFKTSFAVPAALALMITAGAVVLAEAEDDQPNPPQQSWSFYGVFGKYDQAQLQRGFQVYREVCSTCHRLSIPFRTLEDPDGPGYSVAQVKALAASYQVENAEPNDKGEMFKRPGTPADIFHRRTRSPTTPPRSPRWAAYRFFVPGLLIQLALFGSTFVGFAIISDWRSGVMSGTGSRR